MTQAVYCVQCAQPNDIAAVTCIRCGAAIVRPTRPAMSPLFPGTGVGGHIATDRGKNKTAAGLFALLLGALGVHHFYLGSTVTGVVFLAATILSCGWAALIVQIISIIEGIILLTMKDEEFNARYNHSIPRQLSLVFIK
jgi:TM2 domain-containing membrane protein YozV